MHPKVKTLKIVQTAMGAIQLPLAEANGNYATFSVS
jgi:hypothetical protein